MHCTTVPVSEQRSRRQRPPVIKPAGGCRVVSCPKMNPGMQGLTRAAAALPCAPRPAATVAHPKLPSAWAPARQARSWPPPRRLCAPSPRPDSSPAAAAVSRARAVIRVAHARLRPSDMPFWCATRHHLSVPAAVASPGPWVTDRVTWRAPASGPAGRECTTAGQPPWRAGRLPMLFTPTLPAPAISPKPPLPMPPAVVGCRICCRNCCRVAAAAAVTATRRAPRVPAWRRPGRCRAGRMAPQDGPAPARPHGDGPVLPMHRRRHSARGRPSTSSALPACHPCPPSLAPFRNAIHFLQHVRTPHHAASRQSDVAVSLAAKGAIPPPRGAPA